LENIYNAWLKFKESPKSERNHSQLVKWNPLIEENSNSWRNLPYPKGEYWKYIDYKKLPQMNFVVPEAQMPNQQVSSDLGTVIEINNFTADQSLKTNHLPSGLSLQSTFDLMNEGEEIFLKSFFENLTSQNQFSQSALSFLSSGILMRVEKNHKIDGPIKFIFDLNKFEQKDSFVVFNLIIDMQESSAANVFIEILAQSFSGLANINIFTRINSKAVLSFSNKEKGGAQSHIICHLNSNIENQGVLNSYDITLPSLWSRHNIATNLKGNKAMAQLKGAYLNTQNYFSDHHTEINHLHMDTYSSEDYRGLLTDKAKAVFNGKIFIEKKSARSNSELINKNLLLSKHAEVNTKPELQIYNDDVKASHGATVGSINDEQKFYLLSRGLDLKKAEQLLCQAFVFGLLDDSDESVDSFFRKDIEDTLLQMGESN
jgi:Fe-S cluster assembly protein SufD